MDGLRVTELRVTELAEAAGVAASTVRFYERVGLLSPARRAENGYRLFDPSALDELAFINRAKGIGMTLGEIAEFVTAWPDTECRLLQARLRQFLAKRISQVRSQRLELEEFEVQLQAVAGRLASRDPGAEHCGNGCGCESDLDVNVDPATAAAIRWTCSLDDDALSRRISEWRTLAETATTVEHQGNTVRLALPADPEHVATAARLCAAEAGCCATTSFVIEIAGDSVVLTAQALGGPGVLETLFPQGAGQ